MLDTNIVDRLADDATFTDLLRSLIADSKIQLFITCVVVNQIRQIVDTAKREQLNQVLRTLRATYIPVELAPYGYAYGECYGGISPDVAIDDERFIAGNNDQIEDAMIAATASSKKYRFRYIVTEDKQFRGKMKRLSTTTKAISFDEFKTIAAQAHH